MTRPLFFLIAGPNGGGKSTYTKTVRRKYPHVKVIDPDAIAKSLTGSFNNIEKEQVAAGKAAINLVRGYIKEKQSFLAESTISGQLYLRYIRQANEAGFKTILIYTGLSSEDMSIKRVQARVIAGGHNIPVEDIKRRYPKSIANLHVHIKACDIAYVLDNSTRFEVIATYRKGELYRDYKAVNWFTP